MSRTETELYRVVAARRFTVPTADVPAGQASRHRAELSLTTVVEHAIAVEVATRAFRHEAGTPRASRLHCTTDGPARGRSRAVVRRAIAILVDAVTGLRTRTHRAAACAPDTLVARLLTDDATADVGAADAGAHRAVLARAGVARTGVGACVHHVERRVLRIGEASVVPHHATIRSLADAELRAREEAHRANATLGGRIQHEFATRIAARATEEQDAAHDDDSSHSSSPDERRR